jgi:succinoglycan biosynthesis protein ExoM
MAEHPHISVCICTYKRPHLLKRLLEELGCQETEGLFSYSIVVTDNDQSRSAQGVVSEVGSRLPVDMIYCVEPQQNIALARNRAVANATGSFIAFIDDDEFPIQNWLLTLFKACQAYQVDGALGPVKPYFEVQPPKWVIEGGFYDRPSYKTGLIIDWRKGRTGNTLLKRCILDPGEQAFRPEFRTGEDQDFFRRMIERGYKFVWCHEALAYEVVPPLRWKLSFMLRRALLHGKVSPLHSGFGLQHVAKSVIAVMLYVVALPFLAVFRRHLFILYLVKMFHHLGKILAVLGLNPIRDSYVTD